MSAVAEEDVIVLVGDTISSSDTASDILPPPPGFSPFSWPVDDGSMDNEQSRFPFNVDYSPGVLAGRPGVEPSLSPITLVRSDESVGSPGVGLLVSPLVDVSSDMAADVSRPVSPLPSVESLLLQDMLWAPVAPRSSDVGGGWLDKVRPFLAERSPSVHWGLDVPSGIRLTEVRTTQRHQGSSDFPCITCGSSSGLGFPIRPVFSRWVPDGGWTIFRMIRLWQRDVGLMQTNLDVLDQYTLSLQGTASKLIELCLGARDFPAEEVAAGALGPRVQCNDRPIYMIVLVGYSVAGLRIGAMVRSGRMLVVWATACRCKFAPRWWRAKR